MPGIHVDSTIFGCVQKKQSKQQKEAQSKPATGWAGPLRDWVAFMKAKEIGGGLKTQVRLIVNVRINNEKSRRSTAPKSQEVRLGKLVKKAIDEKQRTLKKLLYSASAKARAQGRRLNYKRGLRMLATDKKHKKYKKILQSAAAMYKAQGRWWNDPRARLAKKAPVKRKKTGQAVGGKAVCHTPVKRVQQRGPPKIAGPRLLQREELKKAILKAIEHRGVLSRKGIKRRLGEHPLVKDVLDQMVREGEVEMTGESDQYRMGDLKVWLEGRIVGIVGEKGASKSEVREKVEQQHRDRVEDTIERMVQSKTLKYKVVKRNRGVKVKVYYAAVVREE